MSETGLNKEKSQLIAVWPSFIFFGAFVVIIL